MISRYSPELIRLLTRRHGIHETFAFLPSTGLANHIYASPHFVLRIPSDHEEARTDAFCEAVAAPLARAQGIMTPELLVFDTSLDPLDRPYTIWERVAGSPPGERGSPHPATTATTWRAVGEQVALLHTRVCHTPDPNGWLERPQRDWTPASLADRVAQSAGPGWPEWLLDEIWRPDCMAHTQRFIHGDIHPHNILCSSRGALRAVIDWGDSGWGDPALDFCLIPPHALQDALEGYRKTAPERVDEAFLRRILLDRLAEAVGGQCPEPGTLLTQVRVWAQRWL